MVESIGYISVTCQGEMKGLTILRIYVIFRWRENRFLLMENERVVMTETIGFIGLGIMGSPMAR